MLFAKDVLASSCTFFTLMSFKLTSRLISISPYGHLQLKKLQLLSYSTILLLFSQIIKIVHKILWRHLMSLAEELSWVWIWDTRGRNWHDLLVRGKFISKNFYKRAGAFGRETVYVFLCVSLSLVCTKSVVQSFSRWSNLGMCLFYLFVSVAGSFPFTRFFYWQAFVIF